MNSKEWVLGLVSTVAAIAFFWYLLDSIKNISKYNLLASSLLLTALLIIAVCCCPVARHCMLHCEVCSPKKKKK